VSSPLEAGERVLLVDRKERRYLLTLQAGKDFHAHHGLIRHDDIIGQPEGVKLVSSGGATMIAFRPGLADFILKMPRGAQVVYPKDIGLILVEADVHPGATVLEAGTGSGALTLALLRAVGDGGRVVSYDLREDHSAKARTNLESFLGKLPDGLELRIGDVAEFAGEPADRLILDLPEPWHPIALASRLLRPGGIACVYVPSTGQMSQAVETMRANGFEEIRPFEVLIRTWHVEGQSVRPDHRMVAHTGFLITARYLG
jgi:tRNA (adenine57-N1/adenine58-N1)-methyltransferase